MEHSEDHIALAAEYALGTLDAEERAQVETMMGVDKEFADIVRAWEFRLGVLNQMVGSVEPRPEVWDNIKAAIGHKAQQAPLVLPDAMSPPPPLIDVAGPAAAPPAAPTVDSSNVIRFTRQARRWRAFASAMTALAAVLIAMIGVQLFLPDLLPDAMRPKGPTRVVEVKTPPTPASQPAAQYVALLQ